MEAYKQRMISELIELHLRYCAAVNALFDERITPENRQLLQQQVKAMCEYEKILRIRMRHAGIDLEKVDGFMQFGSGVVLE